MEKTSKNGSKSQFITAYKSSLSNYHLLLNSYSSPTHLLVINYVSRS